MQPACPCALRARRGEPEHHPVRQQTLYLLAGRKIVYGYAVAADTGGAAMSGNIVADLYYPSESQCENFGTRTMNVYVLN